MRIILVLIICFVPTLIFGQYEDRDAQTPLNYSVRLLKVDTENETLLIKVKLTNVSDRPLVIDKTSLYYQTVFSRHGVRTSDGGVGQTVGLIRTGDSSDSRKPDYVRLLPAESITEKGSIQVNNSYFATGNDFTLKLVYGYFAETVMYGEPFWRGTSTSNELRFRLRGGK